MRQGLLALLLLMSTSVSSPSSTQSLFEVYQPVSLNQLIVVASVPYVHYMTSTAGGVEVGWTCRANLVQDETGEVHNYNIANHLGMTTRVTGLFGDTLRVDWDFSAVPDTSVFFGEPVRKIVAATLECILANANRGRRVFD